MEIYEKSHIRNLLKCNQCSTHFDDYDQPKSLQCGKIVCNKCENKIVKNAVNKKYKCEICLESHLIPEKGLTINELACDLLKSKPQSIWRGKKYEKLKINLEKLNKLKRELKFSLENGNDSVKTYCIEQRRRVQISFEKKMQELNDLNEAFIKQIDDYEEHCIKESKKMNKTTKSKIEKLLTETNNFIIEKQSYLNRLEMEETEIESYNLIAEDLELKLDQEMIDCKSLAFDNKLIKFNSESTETLIGSIDFERINSKEILSLSRSMCNSVIKLWNFDSGICIKKSFNHSKSAACLKQASYNKVIVGYFNGTIRIIDIGTDTCLKLINEHSGCVMCIQLISKDKFITCSIDKSIKLFDLNTGYLIRTFYGHEDEVNCIDRLDDKKIVSCSNDNKIKVWDLNSGECLKTIEDSSLCVLAFSNKQILSGSSDKTIKLWDIVSGECLRIFEGHTKPVRCFLKLSNEKICSGSEDETIKVWDINTGECLMTTEHGGSGSYINIKKLDNIKIASGTDGGQVMIWDLNTGKYLKSLTCIKGDSGSVFGLEILT